MGYYTELELSIQLSKDAPLDIIEKLANSTMYEEIVGHIQPSISSVADLPNLLIAHSFGKTHRWDQIFNPYTTIFNKEQRTLKIKCEIKAYDEIYEKLIDWLKPYIINGKARSKGESMDCWIDLI